MPAAQGSLKALPFVVSVFISAFLLFLVQPLTAKLLLPVYGGSPAVWNTSLVFFQTALLAGYLYAYGLARIPSTKAQLALHSFVLLATLAFLPIELNTGSGSALPAAGSLMLALGAGVGLPFFVLASNSSLMQHWYGQGRGDEQDPYWMYGASNFGSLLALLFFPLVLEPFTSSAAHAEGWSLGYWLFLIPAALAMLGRLRTGPADPDAPARKPNPIDASAESTPPAVSIAPQQRLDWVLRAAVGSSLLLAVTMRLTTDVGTTPLLWTLPLALYLTSFIIAFAYGDRLPVPALVAVASVLAFAGLGLVVLHRAIPIVLSLLIGFSVLFVGALLCHVDLVRTRPHSRHLTEFYLWIAVGGAAGGALNALVAPYVFDSVAEYPITLAALAWVAFVRPRQDARAGSAAGTPPPRLYRPSFVTGTLGVAALSLPFVFGLARQGPGNARIWMLGAVSIGLLGFALRRYVGLIAIVPTVAAILVLAGVGEPYDVVAQDRSFFGVSRIWRDGDRLLMAHGSTVHGSQSQRAGERGRAGTYYHADGPLGSLVAAAAEGSTVGIVGLGAGELAALTRAGQTAIFYEIDETVIDFAQRHFTFLADAPANVRVVPGDGRQTLSAAPPASHDVLVIDAFTGDHVPTHLLTAEALGSFLERLTEEGVLVVHTSNRHADLRRVVKGFAEESGVPALYQDFEPTSQQASEGATRTTAIALTPSPVAYRAVQATGFWSDIPASVEGLLWTDDRSSLLQLLWSGGALGGDL